MQDGTLRLLVGDEFASPPAGDDAEADGHLRDRIRTLIAVARELSDACADFADALRPLPGNGMDDPLTMDFSRLRAERTAALLDEAASATRGTLGLLGSAYTALGDEVAPDPATDAAEPAPGPATAAAGATGLTGSPPPAAEPAPRPAAPPAQPPPAQPPAESPAGQRWIAASQSPPSRLGSVNASVPSAYRPPTDSSRAGPFRPAPEPGPARLRPAPSPSTAGWSAPGPTPPGATAGGPPARPPAASRSAASLDAPNSALPRPAPPGAGAPSGRAPAPPGGGAPGAGTPDAGALSGGPPGADTPGAGAASGGAPSAGTPGALVSGRGAASGAARAVPPPLPVTPPLVPDPRESTWPDAFVKPRLARLPTPPPLPAPEPTGRHGAPAEPAAYPVAPAQPDKPAEPGATAGPAVQPEDLLVGPPSPPDPPNLVSPPNLASPPNLVSPPTPAGPPNLVSPPTPAGPPNLAGPPAQVDPPRARPEPEPAEDAAIEPAQPEPYRPLDDAPPSRLVAFPVDEPGRFDDLRRPASELPAANGSAAHAASLSAAPLQPPAVPPTAELPTTPELSIAPELPAAPELPTGPAEEFGTALPTTAEPATEPAGAPGPGGLAEPVAEHAGLAVLARQVEAARRHLQAAVVVAHDQADHPAVGGLLTAVEQVLDALTELARTGREALPQNAAGRVFPGEARFLCSLPWEHNCVVAADPHGSEPAGSTGLCRLLVALGYDAQMVTGAAGSTSVQVRTDRYAAHVALVEPAGGGRQRWSGALEWVDGNGTTRTWAETLGPVELDEEELARRVDELLRRCVGPTA